MKYLHLMSNEKFTAPYIEFIEENFPVNEHLFYIIGGVSYVKVIKKEFIRTYISEASNKILRKLYILWAYLSFCPNAFKSKKIILHGLFSPLTILFLFLNPWFLKKCNWVMWGGDLYSYRNRKYNTLLKKIYYKIEDYVKGNISYISYLAKGDYTLAKQYYNSKGFPERAIYINPVNLKELEKLEKKFKDKKTLNIQIGNSADPENNHFEILNEIKKYKNENIKIYAPLSYGNPNYALEIKKYGESIFGEKFIGMLEFLEPQKYAEYLSDIDVLIFNHKRQQGLGNIFALSYLNKKIYLRSDISSWDYLTKDLCLEIYDIKNIKNEEFAIFRENTVIKNKIQIKNTVYSKSYIKKIWEKNFNS